MAEALRHISECAICMLQYENPKVLPCDHTFCANCVEGLRRGSRIKCPLCNQVHKSTSVRADFRLAQFLDVLKQKENENNEEQKPAASSTDEEITCEICCKEPIWFRCDDCSQWICKDCKTLHLRTTATKNHRVLPRTIKFKEIKEKFIRKSKKIKKEIGKLEVARAEALEVSDNLRKKSNKEINDYFDSIDARIIEYIQSNIEKLEKQQEELNKQLQLANPKWKTLEQLVKSSAAQLPTEGISTLNFSQFKTIENLRDEVVIDDVEVKVLQGLAWDASKAAILRLGDQDITSLPEADETELKQRCNDEPRNELPPSALYTLGDKILAERMHIQSKGSTYALRQIGQQLWLCKGAGVIEVYDLELEFQYTLANGDWGDVFDVTEVLDDQLVLSTQNGLFCVRYNGSNVCELDYGPYCSAAFHDDIVYAYARKNPIGVRVFEYFAGMGWVVGETLTLPFKETAFVTLSATNGVISACSDDDNRVVILSPNGQILQTLGSNGSSIAGKLNCPFLCQVDSIGSLLIADSHNHRLQIVDKQTQWKIVTTDSGVRSPISAVFTSNKLYVVFYKDGYKVSMFI